MIQDIPCDKCIHNEVCNVRKCIEETKVNTTHPYVIVKLECTQYINNNILHNKLIGGSKE